MNEYLVTLHRDVSKACIGWTSWLRDTTGRWVSRSMPLIFFFVITARLETAKKTTRTPNAAARTRPEYHAAC